MKIKTTLISAAFSCLLASTQSAADTTVGAYVDYDGWSLNTIDQFNADTARNATAINIFSTFDFSWNHLGQQSRNIVSRNAVPLITLMPYTSATPSANVLQEIVQGQWDAYITSWIAGFQSWRSTYPSGSKPSILLRFGHEFNGNWYPWGNKPTDLKAAWRYLHNKFTTAGVNDFVGWVWCANNVDVDSYNNVMTYYPGDDVVDWLSIDGYNWGSNYSFTRWKTFDETFSQQYVKMVSAVPTKPLMLAEVSSAEPHDMPNSAWGQNGDNSDALESKEVWTADMLNSIQSHYPAIKSIVWFNTNKELSWALNKTGNTGLTAYNSAVVGNYFGGTLSIKSPAISPLVTATALSEASEPAPQQLHRKKAKNNRAASHTRVIEKDTVKGKGAVHPKGWDIATRHVPEVVGARLLQKEAEGLRAMPKSVLKRWRAHPMIK